MKTLTLWRLIEWDKHAWKLKPTHTYFESEESAIAWAKDHRYDMYHKDVIHVFESILDYKADLKKQYALSKLTLEEQQLLGLK